jgi:hypothetical protein
MMVLMRKEGLFAAYGRPHQKHSRDSFRKKDALITAWRILPISILEGRLNDVKELFTQWLLVAEQKRRCLTVDSI